MSGKPNKAWLKTMVKKHGSREAVAEVMSKLGRQGGKMSSGGGFQRGSELARKAGKIGGTKSRRGKSKK